MSGICRKMRKNGAAPPKSRGTGQKHPPSKLRNNRIEIVTWWRIPEIVQRYTNRVGPGGPTDRERKRERQKDTHKLGSGGLRFCVFRRRPRLPSRTKSPPSTRRVLWLFQASCWPVTTAGGSPHRELDK